MATRVACMALAVLGLAGCFPSGPDLPDDRQPRGVRVLGALSQPASGAPGAELALSLEAFDAAPLLVDLRRAVAAQNPELVIDPEQLADAPGGPLSVAWLGGCHNPPGDAQSGCYPLLQEVVANLPDPLPESGAVIPAELARFFGVGQNFSLRIPDDILAGRQLDTAAPAFGVSFTFFAVCRGVLRPAPGGAGVPLRCHDRDSDELLGAEAFVRGFVTTYTYEGSRNAAPELLGTTIDGVAPPQRACVSDDDCADLALGELPFACGRPLAPTFSVEGAPAPLRCLPRVSPCNSLSCVRHELLPQLVESSVELDPAATPPGGAAPDEVMWVKYFGFGGFDRDEALINDRASGFNPDYGLSWSAPPLALETPLPVWAVVQDNRGGTSVARWDFLVRE